MAKVFIEVRGGQIQFVGTNSPSVEIFVIDWDNAEGTDATELDRCLTPMPIGKVMTEEEMNKYFIITKNV